MAQKEIKWSQTEKKIARRIFDLAFQREMDSIKQNLYEKVANLKENSDVWKLHDYLTDCRYDIDKKYDYRYSRLLIVFGVLYAQGFLNDDDIKDFRQEKIDFIKRISET